MSNVTKNGVQTIVTIDFGKWFYQENQIKNIPAVDGIYVAHAGTLKEENNKEVFCYDRVIYIGKGTGTDNVHVRIGQHINNDHVTWKKHLKVGESILYTYAECSSDIVGDVEAALIYINKPQENANGKDCYTGNTHFLNVKFTGEAKGALKETGLIL